MRLPTYRRTGSVLHAARTSVALAYIAALCTTAILFDHPLLLIASLASVVGAGVAAGLASELARAARFAAPLAALVALINPLVSQEGLTVLVSGPIVPVLGRLDITLEALAWGGVAALRVLVVTLAFALYSAAVDPDELLRLLRRLSFRSSLTASLATRLVPVLARDAERLADAYELRAARPQRGSGRLARLRRASILTRALAAGALERAVELAAALEVRGYAAGARFAGPRAHLPWSRNDSRFVAAAIAAVLVAVAGRIAGVAAFDPYPSLRADLHATDIGLALALCAILLSPFYSRWPRRSRFPSERAATRAHRPGGAHA